MKCSVVNVAGCVVVIVVVCFLGFRRCSMRCGVLLCVVV